MKEAERMNLPPKGDVRASIEARQDRWRPPAAPAGGVHVTAFKPSGIVYVDGDGREVPIERMPDEVYRQGLAQRIARERAESDAREAFERAVVDDFAASAQLYLIWWNAHLDAGGRGIAPFAELVQVVLVRAARVRRDAP